jgi:dTMP kinase
MSSLFISLEGGEGAGKSTQARLLAQFLTDRGHQVLLTREPGGTSLGATIRQLFLQSEYLTPMTELFLLMSDRSHHVNQLIRPSLLAGKIVITDRFVDSTVAYQGFGHGIDRDWIDQLNYQATGGLMPQLTFWLDVPPHLGLERASMKTPHQDRMEKLNLQFHQSVRQGFETVWQREPDRVKRIDGSLSVESVSQSIRNLLEQSNYFELLSTVVKDYD